jgi:hypothetical protein
VIPVRDAKHFQRLIPDCRTVVLPDTGHVAMIERPERFNALLEAFLAEAPAAPAVPVAATPDERAATGEALSGDAAA